MRLLIVTALCIATLAGCSSAVKLDPVPVEDKSGSSVPADKGTGTDGTSVPKGAVATVDLTKKGDSELISGMTRVVYFDFDSYVIRSEFQSVIEAHARFLKGDPKRKVLIAGHTDERGGREYNLALGQKRAEAVRKALTILGVSEAQLEAVSFGKEKPVDTGTSEAAMEKNRRAEISYR
jgi:peptidoglycan-associated lipoprotein